MAQHTPAPRTWVPLSGAPLDEDPRDEGREGPLDLAPEGRYEDGGQLGRGGMGEVRMAHDRRLERDVALKVTRSPDTRSEVRLLREATTTARLEHPGIVPVYDAGRLDDGRPYYTMPVLRGRSLADRIAAAPDLAARLRLLRHFLDTCGAVAFAHSQGVVHRDLKPANIMVGEFGETMVVDWGLACPIGAPPQDGEAGAIDKMHTSVTDSRAAAGTPAYMSPEQRDAAPVTADFDVYSLGATLHELLTASTPRAHDAPDAPIRPVHDVCPEAPVELAAIADKATSPRSEDRYESAAALTADVEAWFEGRRVAAHSYTLREELARFVARWRVPLTVGVVMGVGLVLALVSGWRNTTAERNRALIAESEAVAARDASDAYLASALVAQALVAIDDGQRAEAEILAAHALTLTPSPEARGVLARYGLEARPKRVGSLVVTGCSTLVTSLSGARVACVRGDSVAIYDPSKGDRALASVNAEPVDLAFMGDDHLAVLDGDLALRVLDATTGAFDEVDRPVAENRPLASWSSDIRLYRGKGAVRPVGETGLPSALSSGCPRLYGVQLAVVRPDGKVAMMCGDRTLRVADGPDTEEPWGQLDADLGQPIVMGLDALNPDRVVVGSEDGEIVIAEPGRGETARLSIGVEPVGAVALYGDRLAVSGMRGGVSVWDVSSGARLARLPDGRAAVRWLGSGDVLRVVGTVVEDWEIPAHGAQHLIDLGAGVAAIAVSSDGSRVAAGLGDGTVRVVEVARAVELLRGESRAGVAKDVAFSPDGALVATGGAVGQALQIISVADGQVTSRAVERMRRVSWLRDGTLVVAPYGGHLEVFRPGAEDALREDLPIPDQPGDMEPWPDGRGAVIIDQVGNLWRFDAAEGLEQLAVPAAPDARGIDGSVDAIWLAEPRGFAHLDGRGRLIARLPDQTDSVLDIAASPDQSLVALAHLDGTVTVWSTDDLTLLATLRGHAARASALSFSPDGAWLASGSWDGTVRLWDLSALRVDPAALVGPIEAAWGRDLEAALRR